MASKRAAVLVPLFSAVWLLAASTPAPGQGPSVRTVDVIGLPRPEVEKLFATIPMRVGLGVFPESRRWERFIDEIGYAAPPREVGSQSTRQNLFRAAIGDRATFSPSGSIPATRKDRILGYLVGSLLQRGFSSVASQGASIASAIDARKLQQLQPSERPLTISAFETAEEVVQHLRQRRSAVYVILELGGLTPLRVGLCEGSCVAGAGRPGLIGGSITRRPGIVTPYDLSATIVDRLGIPIPESFGGNTLTGVPEPDATEKINSLAARLERDDSYAPGLAAVTVSLGVLTIFFAYGLMRRGRNEAALRIAQGAVFILPGWAVALFVPSGRWQLRALVVLAGVAFGASLRLKQPLRTMAKVGLVSALAFTVLNAVAALNPGGEPGLTIWANPLESWRFFGLANVPAAIIASGIVIWGVIAGLTLPVLAALTIAAAVVTGAPTIGANFVGVLTFVFGAAAVGIALARRRVNLGQVALAGVISVAAFALALLADAGSPVSHGGRAARKISNGGLSAAWDLVEGRLRLNWELILDFTGGVLWVIGLAISLAMLVTWGLRAERGPFRGRVAVLGGALMAFASLVLEDSGFYSGAVLWFVAADAWLLITLASPRLGVIPPDGDAPLAGVGAGTKPPQPGAARRRRSWPG